MEEENELCRFGTPLDPIEEDEVPSKKPITKEDLIAVDENGRRRFHGAFTGGFSAGYWNTVGSLEGWKPKEFKSSRQEKAGKFTQSIEDFMDSEDTGEFGIAPRRIQTQKDFASSSNVSQKRKYTVAFENVGRFEGVLEKIMTEPVADNIGTRLLRRMGWREGQGVGSRLTRRKKKEAQRQHRKEEKAARSYGCALGPIDVEKSQDEASDSSDSDSEVTFAPDDYDSFTITPKVNLFGLGYVGLERNPVLSQTRDTFAIMGKNNKKLVISGKAFGVGAFEEEDDDIYGRDDMTQYDFTLEDKRTTKKTIPKAIEGHKVNFGIEGFTLSSLGTSTTLKVFRIELPRDYQPRNYLLRKSRFAPLPQEVESELRKNSRSEKTALAETPSTSKSSDSRREERKSEKTSSGTKFFARDLGKQERFEKFLEISDKSSEEVIKEFFRVNQPLNLSLYECQMEQREFLQVRRMHRPLAGLMSDRFVSACSSENPGKSEENKEAQEAEKSVQVEVKESPQQPAVEGPEDGKYYSKRIVIMWKPHPMLCKRFNVPEPYGGVGMVEEVKKKNRKGSKIFECLRDPINQKIDFTAPKEKEEAPVIEERREKPPLPVRSEIPRHQPEKPQQISRWDMKEAPPPLPVLVPKTDLEIAIQETKDKHPAEKKDLFKAIFEDSDDDTSEPEAEKDKQEKVTPLAPPDINPLINMSEPQGIFSKLFQVRQAAEKKKEEQERKAKEVQEVQELQELEGATQVTRPLNQEDQENPEIFGPALPPSNKPIFISRHSSKKTLLDQIQQRDEEKWVEKAKVEKNKKKKREKEKHKKEKKHKKHKKKSKSRD
ncbi:G patch domain-containing protein 1 homolog [Sergentomyia squamirostris]